MLMDSINRAVQVPKATNLTEEPVVGGDVRADAGPERPAQHRDAGVDQERSVEDAEPVALPAHLVHLKGLGTFFMVAKVMEARLPLVTLQ